MKKWLIISSAALTIMAGGVGTWYFVTANQAVPLPAPQVMPIDEKGQAPLHPLMVEAVRARTYTASEITTERTVAQTGAYTSYVVSYSSDGFKVYALMNVPAGTPPPGGWPVLILNHGYIPPDSYQTTGGDYRYWIDGLSRNGYLLIKPDYRGHGQSEGDAEGGHWSPVYTYDLLNLIESLKGYQLADGGNIGVLGHSMGANVALRAMVATDDIKASALLAGVVGSADDLFYSWRSTRRWVPRPGIISRRQHLVDEYGEPKDNPGFWSKVSSINYVDVVTGPVQIHHGTDDESVPKLFSDHLNEALVNAGKPVEYFEYQNGDHQFSGTSGTALTRMLALFNSQLKNGSM